MPFNGCFDYGRRAFIKASNLMASQELLYPARNYYDTETYRSAILVTCILLRKLVAGYDCKNRHEINKIMTQFDVGPAPEPRLHIENITSHFTFVL